MSTDTTGPQADAQVIQLRAAVTSTESDLAGTPPPAYLDTTNDGTVKRLPVIPQPLQRANIRGTIRRQAGLRWHQARYHGFRSPVYLILYLWHIARGAAVLTGRLIAWWQAVELRILLLQAVAAGRPGHQHAMSAHAEGKKTRAQRGRIIACCAAVVVIAGLLMARLSPWWGWALAAVVVAVVLERHGRKPGRPMIRPAVVAPKYQPLTQDVVIRALGSLGLTVISKYLADGGEIAFIAPGIVRDGPGSRVVLDLPPGITADEVIKERAKFAAALRRPLACVWPEGQQEEHPGRLVLYVCDESLNKARQPAWPLTTAPKTSMFQPVPFGTDQRMRPVTVTLMFANLLIGSISRMGKTGALRLVLLAAALDPLAELHVWELKGTGDLEPLERIAHSYGSGADDETIGAAFADLLKVHRELERRAKVIRELPKDVCPHKKVTPELARKRSLRLHPIVFAVDEAQEVFTSKWKAEFEELCLQLIRRGPALGIMLVLATQRPDAKSLPTGITANIALRFCLKVMDQTSNDMVLGTSAYKRGINATLFAFEDKGLGWAVGFAPDARIIKGYDLDVPAADRVALRARAAREAAGTLTGHAAGQDDAEPVRSFAADVLTVFGTEDKLWSSTIAARLAEQLPSIYPAITAAAVTSQLRGLGVTVKNVRESGQAPGQGCDRTAIEAVAP